MGFWCSRVVLVAVFKQKAQSSVFNLISLNSPVIVWVQVWVFAWAGEHVSNSNSQKTFKWQWQFYCGSPEKDKGDAWLARGLMVFEGVRGRTRLACKVQQFYRLLMNAAQMHTHSLRRLPALLTKALISAQS